MILTDKKQNFEASNIGKLKAFKVQEGPKLFNTIFDRLYNDKIRAVIRELSTNAWEVHKQIGKESVPFLVKLPNWNDLNFVVRDYGTGLTEYQINEIYTTAFRSTKEDSNDVGGCFGLGSKAPFCYVDNFIVNSYIAGKKYSYFFMRDANRLPSYSKVSETSSPEPDGLEIIIAARKEDIQEFSKTASDIYRWFEYKPNVTGNNLYVEVKNNKPLITGDGWAYHQEKTYGFNHRPIAVMANVAYDLSAFPQKNKFLMDGMVIYFNIGDVAPNPGRESLSFDKETIKAVDDKLKLVESDIQKQAETKISQCKNLWEACREAHKLGGIFNLATIMYEEHDVNKTINFPSGKYLKQLTNNRSAIHTVSCADVRNCTPNCIVDDLKKGGVTRAKLLVKNQYPSHCFFCAYGDDIDEFKRLLLIKDDQIVLTSSLPKPTYGARSSRGIHKTKVMLLKAATTSATYCWEDAEVDLKEDSGYYVEICNNKFKYQKDGRHNLEYHPMDLYKISKELGFKIYGIKSSIIKSVGPNWKNAIAEMKDKIIDFSNQNKSALENAFTLSSFSNKNMDRFSTCVYAIKQKFIGENELTTFHNEFKNLQKECLEEDAMCNKLKLFNTFLLDIYGIQRYNIKENEKIMENYAKIRGKYPLLFRVFTSDKDDLKELHYYVKQILENGR